MTRSPRMLQFEADTARDPVAALESLKRDLEASTGPLVEQISDNGNVLVTFVVRGAAGSTVRS